MKWNSITHKISFTFLTIGTLLSISVLLTISQANTLQHDTEKIMQKNFPKSIYSARMRNEMNRSLSFLRGWIILKDEEQKLQRHNSINGATLAFTKLQNLYSGNANLNIKKDLAQIKLSLKKFQQAQLEVEDLAHTQENNLAEDHLERYIAPLQYKIFNNISDLIELESHLPSSKDRKKLFTQMANFRGYHAASYSYLEKYIFTKKPHDKLKFHEIQAKATKSLNSIKLQSKLLSPEQSMLFVGGNINGTKKLGLRELISKLGILTKKAFDLREQVDWNQAFTILRNEAIPTANLIRKKLSAIQSESENQTREDLLAQRNSINKLAEKEWVILILGISACIFMSIFLSNKIKRPLKELLHAAEQISKGDISQDLHLKGFSEIEELSISFGHMSAKLQNFATQAKSIGDGNLDIQIQIKNNKDIISHALKNMANKLKERAAAMAESDARNLAIIDTSLDSIISITPLGIVLSFNESAEKLFGYSPDEVIGKNIKMLMPPPYAEEHDSYLAKYMETGKSHVIGIGREAIAMRKNGSTFDIFLSVGKIINNDGEVHFVGFVRNISEEKQREKQLQENISSMAKSEAINRGIVDTSVDAIISITTEGIVISFNEAAEKEFGYNAEEVIDKNIKMLMPSPYAEEHDGYLKRYMDSGVSRVIGIGREAIGMRKDGSIFDLYLSLGRAEGEDGSLNFVGFVRNISEEKQREKQLQDNIKNSEELNLIKTRIAKISNLAQGCNDIANLGDVVMSEISSQLTLVHAGLYICKQKKKNDDGAALYLAGGFTCKNNAAFPENLDYGERLAGQCAQDKKIIIREELPCDYLQISAGAMSSKVNVLAVPLMSKDKLIAVMELISFDDFDTGKVELLEQMSSNMAVIISNLGSRQQTQISLEKARLASEALLQQQEELKRTNEELNKQTEELKDSQEQLQKQSEELQAANEELEEKTETLEEQKRSVEVKNQEIQMAQKDLQQQADKLAQASKYKSEFLANMSHELRTPLNSLLILAENLAENDSKNLDEEEVESAKIIYDGGIELLTLINDILDLSKVEAGKMTINWESISLASICKSMKRKFSHMADTKGLQLLIDVNADTPAHIRSDGQRVEQILKNLLSNALKFTSEGSVTLKVSYAAHDQKFHSGLQAENTLAISVIDTGIGIPPDKQKAIFEAFQQADGSTTRNYGGTGLGLAISREFSRLLGGEVGLSSVAGEGSIFTLYLPFEAGNELEQTQGQLEAEAPAVFNFEKITEGKTTSSTSIITDAKDLDASQRMILIIEDDLHFARILKNQAEKDNFKGRICGSGSEGLRLADQLQPQAILLDLGLPDMDGMQVLEKLKENTRTRHIPVHIVTGAEKQEESSRKGAVNFVQKPASKSDINSIFQGIEKQVNHPVKKILIIEDDPGSQIALKKLLSSSDIETANCSSGSQVFKALDKDNFDCLILDITLPDTNGFELLSQLREQGYFIPPVVVYTGRELSRDEHKLLNEFTESIVIKGEGSSERLLDEVALFLHSVDSSTPKGDKPAVTMNHDNDKLLEGRKVLLVDDDFRNTFALAKILQKDKMKVVIAENGQVALDKLAEEEFDVVLMDIMMPVMDGYVTMKKIREQEKFKELPIIALTAKAMVSDRAQCIEAGANDYLAKPVDKSKLKSLLSVWLFKKN